MSSVSPPEPGWTVILPLKGGPTAKSRLRAPAALATAIALDCLDAVLAGDRVSAVVVVTPDSQLAARAAAAGAEVRAESAPGSGLLRAVSDGLAGVVGPVAVLLGDLPALRADDLATALQRCAERLGAPLGAPNGAPDGAATGAPERTPDGAPTGAPPMVFVPDAEGTGTVLLTALTPAAMRPSFGAGSAAAHQAAGAFRLDLDLPRLRRDVDTAADLRTAIDLGVGPRTQVVLAEISV